MSLDFFAGYFLGLIVMAFVKEYSFARRANLGRDGRGNECDI